MKFEPANDYLKRMGLMEINEAGAVNLKPGVNMMVACTDCGMTMPCFSALVNEEGLTYCGDCAKNYEEPILCAEEGCKNEVKEKGDYCPDCDAARESVAKEDDAFDRRNGLVEEDMGA